MEKHCFHLFPETFLWCKNKMGLVYNSKTGNGFRFINDKSVRQITEKLNNMANLYCIEIESNDTKDLSIVEFIEKVQAIQGGKLVKQIPGQPNPIVLPPLLNLQSDIERLRKESPILVGEHVLDYLHEVFLHVNTLEDKTQVMKNLDFFRIDNFLESVLFSSVSHIHICGEDVVAYPDLMLLIDKLDKMHLKKSIHIKSSRLEKQEDLPDIFTGSQYQLVVEIDTFLDTNRFDFVITILTNKKVNVAWHFYIKSVKEYEFAESLIKKYNFENSEIKPAYTGENRQFFEYNIYLTEDDLQSPGLNKREIFAHQALNTNDFGKLAITSDGKVYANPHFPALGIIEDDIRELVYKEMDQGTSWRRIRVMKPCCDCVYQWLCPSPSNYELA
ncbi:MAG: TIGR04150 pseudo-rSAM protein, partial [Draconibacterium sp.]|nr:TIGR04150 pseudo-rSAM protein [Draconibacterium sp.]